MKCQCCGQEIIQPTIVYSSSAPAGGVNLLESSPLDGVTITKLGRAFAGWCYSKAAGNFMDAFLQRYKELND